MFLGQVSYLTDKIQSEMGEEKGSSVTVAVRVRPMNKREVALGTTCCIRMDKNQTILTPIGVAAHKADKVHP